MKSQNVFTKSLSFLKYNLKKPLFIFSVSFSCIVLSIFVYSSCNKSSTQNKPVVQNFRDSASLKTNVGITENHLKSDSVLNKHSKILYKLFNSTAWRTVPPSIIDSIMDIDHPHFETFDNIPMKAIIFDISGNNPKMIYHSLLVYVLNDKFMVAIGKSEKIKDGYTRISLSDIKNNDYMHLLVDKKGNMGKFKLVQEMDFSSLVKKDTTAEKFIQSVSSKTCMQTNKTWSGCMNCAVGECASDWTCTFGCAAEWQGCLIVFSASCAFHAS